MDALGPFRRPRNRRLLWLLAFTLSLATVAVAAEPAPDRGDATHSMWLRAVGPLFANAKSDYHYCTASVVHSRRGDVLLTAAHCVTGSGAGLVFAPGFHNGAARFGRWTVTAAYLDPGWVKWRDPRRDFAFLTVAPRRASGRNIEIEQVTGAAQLALRAAPGRRVTVIGYPAGRANASITCTVRVYYVGISPAFDCDDYVSGTSGSPWLARTKTGAEVVALIGGRHQGGCTPSTSYSPPFGAPVLRAYRRAAAHSAGDSAPAAGGDGC